MPKITLDIPENNVALFLEVTEALGIETDSIVPGDLPDWHKQILNERFEEYKSGTATITSWEEFKQELDKEDDDAV